MNRIALVTGGCGPLGSVLCRRLAADGANVIAADLPDAVDRWHPQDAIAAVSVDLTRPGDLDHLVATIEREHGRLDVLVHNAAFTGTSSLRGWAVPFAEQSDEAFDAAVELNLSVPFRLTRRALPLLHAGSDAVIVNIASIYGLVGPDLRLYEGTSMGNPAGYAAAKGGLIQLTRYLAAVLAPQVRVNAVAPGGLARGQDPQFVARYEERTPLRRMGTEDDVAGTVAWLASNEARYVTGLVLAVDGGWTAR